MRRRLDKGRNSNGLKMEQIDYNADRFLDGTKLSAVKMGGRL